MSRAAYRRANQRNLLWVAICLVGLALEAGILIGLSAIEADKRFGAWELVLCVLPFVAAVVFGWWIGHGWVIAAFAGTLDERAIERMLTHCRSVIAAGGRAAQTAGRGDVESGKVTVFRSLRRPGNEHSPAWRKTRCAWSES